jgi:C4-dicarboxylate-specific signal transduction histidine kinase
VHASRLSEIGQMAAALAHELNQPLSAVASYMGGGRRILSGDAECDTECRRKLIVVMEQASAQALRAGEIIRRMRELVRVGESEKVIEDVSAVLLDAAYLATVAAKHGGVAVEQDFAECGAVLVDKIQIQQVVLNLVRNAIEAMATSPKKVLTLKLASHPEHVEFSVIDTGVGLSEAMTDRLFSPFSSTKDDGMGIGLSVCREIIEAHGGKIWAETNLQGGTVFRFTLPLILQDDLQSAAS